MKIATLQHIIAYNIQIEGLVQGVGFRPFIYKLAIKHHVKGWVRNTIRGVEIHAESDASNLDVFLQEISTKMPKAAAIQTIQARKAGLLRFNEFAINVTENKSDDCITQISPDIGLCEECLIDLKAQKHRINYPFINCTHCGPRFSIVTELPYDRAKTSMHSFDMCKTCKSEYTNVSDRRYHAQPVACNSCGPAYVYVSSDKRLTKTSDIVGQIVSDLRLGKIVALKGVGGYTLLCDAQNESAVKRLRKTKTREHKPFAVMFASIQQLKKYACVSGIESETLQSWRKPIVILESKNKLPISISNGFSTIGALLPYSPMHYLLFEKFTHPIVFTSANPAGAPLIIENSKISEINFCGEYAIVEYNRDIVNRVDDSVVKSINKNIRIVRRSRGYVPEPITFNVKNTPSVVGAGAELNACFAINLKNSILPSQFIGDVQNVETMAFYEEAFQRFCSMYRFKAEIAAHDFHPDYLSTRFAQSLNIPTVAVQHHHTHIVSCMAENQEKDKVIGVCFDGTGLGTDGNIWGSEFMVADYIGFERLFALEYVDISGGDTIVKKPWKTAMSYLFASGLLDKSILHTISSYKQISQHDVKNYEIGLRRNINTHKSCSMGRLFDAVSAITGVCAAPSFHGEAPMRLEDIINKTERKSYALWLKGDKIVWQDLWTQLLKDMENKVSVDIISAKFHNAIVEITFQIIKRIRRDLGLKKVVLSGGVFQNGYLLKNIEERLKMQNFQVLPHRKLPYNDGNIAIGQVAIVAQKYM